MTKKKANPQRAGRKSGYDKVNLEHIKFLVEKACTDFEICQFLKISRETFYAWQREHPEFSDALKNWKKNADERVERSLFERAMGYSHPSEEVFCAFGKVTRVNTIKHYPPSEVACIFWLKNRRPDLYRDKPPEPEDEELKNAELVFAGVPKDGKLNEKMQRFFNN